jgi:hypothetical protein
MVSLPAVKVSPETLFEEQAARAVASNRAEVAATVRQIVLREIAIRGLLREWDKNMSILTYF